MPWRLTQIGSMERELFLYTAKAGVPIYTILPESVLLALEECPQVTDTRFFWSGQGKRETAVCDWQDKIKGVFDLAGIVKGLSNAVSHRLRDTFAVELLLAGVPIERVSVLLGHQSIRITEKHYSPWTRSRQEQIEAVLAAAWKQDPALVSTNSTSQVRRQKATINYLKLEKMAERVGFGLGVALQNTQVTHSSIGLER